MQRILTVLTVVAFALTGACSKKDKDEGKTKPKPAVPSQTTDSTANIPAFANPNSIELFAQVRKGFKKPMEDFSGTFQMKSALIGWYGAKKKDQKLFLVLNNYVDTCDQFKPMRTNAPRPKNQVSVRVSLETLDAKHKAGGEPLDGVTIKVHNGVIYAKSFNRLLMLSGGAKANGLRFDSGTIKEGATVTGSVYAHEKKLRIGNKDYKPAWFKGSFKATVCKRYVKQMPKQKPLPPALGKCPDKTKLTALQSSIDISKEGPFELDTFKYARAVWKDDGATLRVFVTNHDWSAKQLGRLTLPIKDKGQAIITLSLYQKDEVVTIGNYDKRGYKEPMSSSVGLGVLKRNIGLSFKQVKARIIDMRNGKVCGDFDFKGKKSHIAGSFVADLPPLPKRDE